MIASNDERRVSYQFSAVEEFKKSINGSASMKALQTQVAMSCMPLCAFATHCVSSFIISSSPSSFFFHMSKLIDLKCRDYVIQ
jgi:hypothetical protein